MKEQQPYQRN